MGFEFIPEKSVKIPNIEFADEVRLPVDETAVVVIDMQNDFVKPDGNLLVPAAADTIARQRQLLDAARQAGVRIAYTQDTHFENDPEWELWPEHCRRGSWGWQIIDELKPEAKDLVCRKNRYDGFYGTRLEHFLSHIWEIKHLVIFGTVSNICVAHTAASAGLRWYHIVVPADGISAQTEFDQALTLRQVSFLYNGDVVRSVADIQFEK
jgi:nicotinamidase-related amidase